MTYQDQYDFLADALTQQGVDVPGILALLKSQKIEIKDFFFYYFSR